MTEHGVRVLEGDAAALVTIGLYPLNPFWPKMSVSKRRLMPCKWCVCSEHLHIPGGQSRQELLASFQDPRAVGRPRAAHARSLSEMR